MRSLVRYLIFGAVTIGLYGAGGIAGWWKQAARAMASSGSGSGSGGHGYGGGYGGGFRGGK